jgi:hypothetical protein
VRYKAVPLTMTGTAYQAAAAGEVPWRVKISQGNVDASRARTTMVNNTLRAMRLACEPFLTVPLSRHAKARLRALRPPGPGSRHIVGLSLVIAMTWLYGGM